MRCELHCLCPGLTRSCAPRLPIGEEEGDWIEAVVGHLRRAKKKLAKRKKIEAKAAEETRKNRRELSVRHTRFASATDGGEAGEGDPSPASPNVPEWITKQLPGLLRMLEACRLLVHVSAPPVGYSYPDGHGKVCRRLVHERTRQHGGMQQMPILVRLA